MHALTRFPRAKRSAKAREWGARGNASQADDRLARGVDADTLHRRALDDRRGRIVRSGIITKAASVTMWEIRHSLRGRVNQYDVIFNGRLSRTCGRRGIPAEYRP